MAAAKGQNNSSYHWQELDGQPGVLLTGDFSSNAWHEGSAIRMASRECWSFAAVAALLRLLVGLRHAATLILATRESDSSIFTGEASICCRSEAMTLVSNKLITIIAMTLPSRLSEMENRTVRSEGFLPIKES
jgi:hypothetical protein